MGPKPDVWGRAGGRNEENPRLLLTGEPSQNGGTASCRSRPKTCFGQPYAGGGPSSKTLWDATMAARVLTPPRRLWPNRGPRWGCSSKGGRRVCAAAAELTSKPSRPPRRDHDPDRLPARPVRVVRSAMVAGRAQHRLLARPQNEAGLAAMAMIERRITPSSSFAYARNNRSAPGVVSNCSGEAEFSCLMLVAMDSSSSRLQRAEGLKTTRSSGISSEKPRSSFPAYVSSPSSLRAR
jgi:hypothetical protein